MDASASETTKKEIALQIEMNAWDFARTLIPQHLHSFMDIIIDSSLEPYYEAILSAL